LPRPDTSANARACGKQRAEGGIPSTEVRVRSEVRAEGINPSAHFPVGLPFNIILLAIFKTVVSMVQNRTHRAYYRTMPIKSKKLEKPLFRCAKKAKKRENSF
jgi:hypothetical protein